MGCIWRSWDSLYAALWRNWPSNAPPKDPDPELRHSNDTHIGVPIIPGQWLSNHSLATVTRQSRSVKHRAVRKYEARRNVFQNKSLHVIVWFPLAEQLKLHRCNVVDMLNSFQVVVLLPLSVIKARSLFPLTPPPDKSICKQHSTKHECICLFSLSEVWKQIETFLI